MHSADELTTTREERAMWMNWWIGLQPFDRQPDRSPATGSQRGGSDDARTSSSERATPMADLAAQTQDSGCSTAVAREAVRGRSWKDLVNGWRVTTKMLRSDKSSSRLLAVVLLRAAILDEMESQQPQVFAAWLAEQYGPNRPRRG